MVIQTRADAQPPAETLPPLPTTRFSPAWWSALGFLGFGGVPLLSETPSEFLLTTLSCWTVAGALFFCGRPRKNKDPSPLDALDESSTFPARLSLLNVEPQRVRHVLIGHPWPERTRVLRVLWLLFIVLTVVWLYILIDSAAAASGFSVFIALGSWLSTALIMALCAFDEISLIGGETWILERRRLGVRLIHREFDPARLQRFDWVARGRGHGQLWLEGEEHLVLPLDAASARKWAEHLQLESTES